MVRGCGVRKWDGGGVAGQGVGDLQRAWVGDASAGLGGGWPRVCGEGVGGDLGLLDVAHVWVSECLGSELGWLVLVGGEQADAAEEGEGGPKVLAPASPWGPSAANVIPPSILLHYWHQLPPTALLPP